MSRRMLAAALGSALLLAACDVGQAFTSSNVTDTSADLGAHLYSDAEGEGRESLTWWFEYGPTPSFGSTTPERTAEVLNGRSGYVEAHVTGLEEGTTYHYRACVRGGLCGRVRTFTTTTGRDSVDGTGLTDQIPELGYALGAEVHASSDADGSNPTGWAARVPGTHYARLPDEGAVTCLRVEGSRAAVGFLGDWTAYDPSLPLVPLVLYVEDNGATGDRWAVAALTEPYDACPDPDALLDAEPGNPVLIGDGFTVHDHP